VQRGIAIHSRQIFFIGPAEASGAAVAPELAAFVAGPEARLPARVAVPVALKDRLSLCPRNATVCTALLGARRDHRISATLAVVLAIGGAARIIVVIADVAAAMKVKLTAALVLGEPCFIARPVAEDVRRGVERIAVNGAVYALVAVVAARGVMQFAEIFELRLEAAVAATAIDMSLAVALRLAAEEEVGHFESVSECIALKRTSLF